VCLRAESLFYQRHFTAIFFFIIISISALLEIWVASTRLDMIAADSHIQGEAIVLVLIYKMKKKSRTWQPNYNDAIKQNIYLSFVLRLQSI